MKQGIIYGVARISTPKQNIKRQVENIKAKYPEAVIIEETYTGTTTDRPAWNKLKAKVKAGDTIVFDEVSRMSRNAAEGFSLYEELFLKGVNLVFLKEPHINTSVYRGAMERHISIEANTGRKAIDKYVSGQGKLLNDLLLDLAREQIELAFESAQQEVDYLHKRTAEGVRRAMAEGKQVGRKQGASITTKKSIAAKEAIRKHAKAFGGTLSDNEVQKLAGISRNSYYKYKAELKQEATQ